MITLLDINKISHQEKLIREYKELVAKKKGLEARLQAVMQELNKADLMPTSAARPHPTRQNKGRAQSVGNGTRGAGKSVATTVPHASKTVAPKKATATAPSSALASATPSGKRPAATMTAVQRQKISESQKKRWALIRRQKQQSKG